MSELVAGLNNGAKEDIRSINGALCMTALKGATTLVHNNINATTLSAAIDMTGYNAILVEIIPAGGTWTIALQGALDTTYVDLYDGTTAMSSGAISTNRIMYWKGVPDKLKINATKGTGTGCTVRIVPMNII